MKALRSLKFILPFQIWSAAAVAAATTVTISPGDLWLGSSQSTPLIYFKPTAELTAVLSQVAHDRFGQPESYTLELVLAANPRLTVKVRRTSDDKTHSAKFIARAGEHTLVELSDTSTKDPLAALNPAGAGGVVLAAPGELKLNVSTELAYDDFGRQQVAAQTFVHAGSKWKVAFSDYTRDGFGRLTGYRATFTQLPIESP